MSTNPSPLKSPGMRVGVGVGVVVRVAGGGAVGMLVAVAVTVAVGVAVGSWISVLRLTRLLLSIGSIAELPSWAIVPRLVIVVPPGVPAWTSTVSVNVAVAPTPQETGR